MDFQAKSYLAGGGLVDAKNWLAFARTSRTAGIGLSPRALEEAQALLEISPGRTGTALNSAFQVFGASTHHMTKQTHKAWSDAKLLDPKTGDIVDRTLYATDPFEWVWKDLMPKLADRGIKTRDQILKWLTDNGQRSTVSGVLADIAIGQAPIQNTATRVESQDPKALDKLVNSDLGKLAALQAAETGFFVALGKFGEGPGLTVLSQLTQSLNGLTRLANEHPRAAADLIAVGGGLAILSKVAGDAAMTIYLGAPLVQGMSALAKSVLPFGKGGAAELAIAEAAGGLGGGSIAALAAAVVLLPPALKLGVGALNDALGIIGKPDASGKGGQARDREYYRTHDGPQSPGPAPPATESWGAWLHRQMSAPAGHQQTHGQATAQHAAYLESPTGAARMIQVNAYTTLDGRVLTKTVTTHQERAASRDPSGITGFDGRQTMLPPSVTTISA